MKIITTPSVEVIAMSQFIGSKTFDIPVDGDDHTKIGSFAAKVCYDSSGIDGRSNEDNQRAVMEHQHGSVLEHSTVSLYITGITRGLSLELNRHRTFAISQRSTRYTAEEEAALVLDPYYTELYERYVMMDEPGNETRYTYKLLFDHIHAAESAFQSYRLQVDELMKINESFSDSLKGFEARKWARGKARNLLPHGLEARGVWTNNHRGWRWFIEARSDRHAEPEIRRLAHIVLMSLKEVSPLYYSDFELISNYDNIPEYRPKFRKI